MKVLTPNTFVTNHSIKHGRIGVEWQYCDMLGSVMRHVRNSRDNLLALGGEFNKPKHTNHPWVP